ncbi:MAG: hypothetical protein JXR10_17100, partial [Cyclobacteriaceae bacterium]
MISANKTDYVLNIAVTRTVDDANGNTSVAETAYTTSTDGASPIVTSVSSPGNATYIVGQNLDFVVNYSESVTVTTTGGTPSIAMTLTSGSETAVYNTGSPSSAITYRYTVGANDADADGVALGALSLNLGTIQDGASNNADNTLNNVATLTGVLVDGVLPAVSATETIDNDGDGTVDYIKVTFTEAVSDASVSAGDFVASIVGDDLGTDGGDLVESFTSGMPNSGTETDVANDAIIYVGVADGTETILANKTDYTIKVAVAGTVDDANGNTSVAETAYNTSTDGASPI